MKTIKDVMTRGVEVIGPDATLKQAAEKMQRLNVGPLPVCEGDKLVGLVTDRDIVVRGIAMGHDPDTSRVSSVMSEDVECIHPDASLDEAAELMEDRQIRRLLVVDDDKSLIGIVSLGDLSQEASDTTTARALEQISEPSRPLH
ncbi:CBS domain-containing protein [Archangium violaceum]|uniref:CBS domain-containing protein n=1 Tax=Archangium violaceum TaxID=83451 RepID=UPI00193C38C0|nr:CBS domain-containing protein [Archangium violaceum]QRK04472.1 CBS domain-containing protein [Archangium violaceum]